MAIQFYLCINVFNKLKLNLFWSADTKYCYYAEAKNVNLSVETLAPFAWDIQIDFLCGFLSNYRSIKIIRIIII